MGGVRPTRAADSVGDRWLVVLEPVRRSSGWMWLSLFRFKIWWMVPATGASAAAMPVETQMLLLESRSEAGFLGAEGSTVYALMLPVLDGGFRASLQGSPEDELQFCFESGDTEVQTMEAVDAVFVNSGDNPFKLLKESIKMLPKIKGTFRHIEDKECREECSC